MERIKVTDDIIPLSNFRAEASSCIKHIHDTKRPMVITQRGKGVAVLLDINEYEAMREKMDVLQEVYNAEIQIEAGRTVPHNEARENILDRIKHDH